MNTVKINVRPVKKAFDPEESKVKRSEITIQLSKSRREEQLRKKRTKCDPTSSNQSASLSGFDVHPTSNLAQIQSAAQDLRNSHASYDQLVQAAKRLRSELAKQKAAPVQAVVDTGVVPRVMELLKVCSSTSSSGDSNTQQLLSELTWILTNIASGTTEHAQLLVDCGVLPILCNILSQSEHSDGVIDSAVWALGNIAGDSPKLRDVVLQSGVVAHFPKVLGRQRLFIARNVAWTLSNLCRGKPQPSFELVRPTLPVLSALIYSQDEDVLVDVCWSFCYLSEDNTVNNRKIDAVLETGISARLVELLTRYPSINLKVPVLRTVGHILTGNDSQTQVMLRHSVLTCLLPLLSHPRRSLRRETCWALSNVTAGTWTQIQAVIDAGAIPKLIHILGSGEFDVQREAMYALSNALSGGQPQQIKCIVSQGLLPPLCNLFACVDPQMLTLCLDTLERLFRASSDGASVSREHLTHVIEECGGLDKLEQLQKHENEKIYDKVSKLLQRYFDTRDEDAEMSVVDSDSGTNSVSTFTFGSSSSSSSSSACPVFSF